MAYRQASTGSSWRSGPSRATAWSTAWTSFASSQSVTFARSSSPSTGSSAARRGPRTATCGWQIRPAGALQQRHIREQACMYAVALVFSHGAWPRRGEVNLGCGRCVYHIDRAVVLTCHCLARQSWRAGELDEQRQQRALAAHPGCLEAGLAQAVPHPGGPLG